MWGVGLHAREYEMWGLKTDKDGETKFIGFNNPTHEKVFMDWVGPHLIGFGVQWYPGLYFSKRITDGHHTYRLVLGSVSCAFIYHPKYLPDGTTKNAFHKCK